MIYLKNLAVGVFLIIFGIYTIIDVNKNPDSQLKDVTNPVDRKYSSARN
jgi:hypothetical protein